MGKGRYFSVGLRRTAIRSIDPLGLIIVTQPGASLGLGYHILPLQGGGGLHNRFVSYRRREICVTKTEAAEYTGLDEGQDAA
jgi:hypothetical protein